MLGDGHGIEAGHVGGPHPFIGGRVKIDVVDPHSELLDEAEAPAPDSPPGQRRPHGDDHVDGRPAIGQTRFELALADRLDHDPAGKARGPVLGPSRTRRGSRRTAPCRRAPAAAAPAGGRVSRARYPTGESWAPLSSA